MKELFRKVKWTPVLLAMLLLSSTVYSDTLGTENAPVSRISCLMDVMQLLGYEEEAQKQLTNSYYSFDFFPMKDIRHGFLTSLEDGYVEVASFNGVAYGKYYTEKEAQELVEEYIKEWEQLCKERGYTAETILVSDPETGKILDPQGNEVPQELLISKSYKYDEKLYFMGHDAVTVSECVAFMVRGIKEDETFIDLSLTWKYAEQIGLIMKTDSFYQKPDADLAKDDFDTLLDRYSKFVSTSETG